MRLPAARPTMEPYETKEKGMATLVHRPLPVVQTYETGDGLVVEIELPAEETRVTTELRGRCLEVRIPRPVRHRSWEVHPDAACS